MKNLIIGIVILRVCCLPDSLHSFSVRGNELLQLTEVTKVADSSFVSVYTLCTSLLASTPPPGTKVYSQLLLYLWH